MSNQVTGAAIITRARGICSDADANGNYAVSDTVMLTKLNGILKRWAQNFGTQPRYYGASVSGLTFTAGLTNVLTNTSTAWTFDINEIADAYQSDSNTIATVLAATLPEALERKTVPEILELYGRETSQWSAIQQTSTDWRCWAAEREGDSTENATGFDKWRFWVYPALSRTQYLTLKAVEQMTLATATNYANVDATHAEYIAHFLAWENGFIQKEMDPQRLSNMLAPVPDKVKRIYYGEGVNRAQLQGHIIEVVP
jgi:hypothetical protein